MIGSDSTFELLKIKVNRFLSDNNSIKIDLLIKEIKDSAFLGDIEDSEAEYLLDFLPLDINEEIDVGCEKLEITHKTGGISINDIDTRTGIRKYIPDELDDFEEDEDEEESGFLGLL